LLLPIADICGQIKGQMQQNLDNFSFAEKPLQKRKFFQHEAESTLKSKFCATGSAKDTEI